MRTSFAVLAVVAVVLSSLPTSDAAQRVQNGTRVECWQYGGQVSQVMAGVDFAIKGSDFRSDLPVWVCISGDVCALSEIDAAGSFYQTRMLPSPGTYDVTIKQARNRSLENWVVRATLVLNVTN